MCLMRQFCIILQIGMFDSYCFTISFNLLDIILLSFTRQAMYQKHHKSKSTYTSGLNSAMIQDPHIIMG